MTKKTASPDASKQQRKTWLTMSEEEQRLPGARLIAWLLQRANDNALGMPGLADALGVTYGYIHQLRSGNRKTAHISDEFSSACARFLGVPRIAVLLAAGSVNPEDFYLDPAHVASRVDEALAHIAKDPRWAPLMPADIHTSSYETRRLIVLLYEEATSSTLLPAAADVDALIAQIHAKPQPADNKKHN